MCVHERTEIEVDKCSKDGGYFRYCYGCGLAGKSLNGEGALFSVVSGWGYGCFHVGKRKVREGAFPSFWAGCV